MNTKLAYASLAIVAALSLGSCTEGQYWNDPESKGQAVAFAKPAVDISVPADGKAPATYEVTLSRTSSEKALTIPVKFATEQPDVLSAPDEVTFEAGKSTATYVIKIGSLMPGLQYSATVTPEVEEGFTHVDSKNQSFSFNISQLLIWKSAGTASVTSTTWVENVTADVAVEEGNWPVAGQRLFRLVDTYLALEPAEVGVEKGADIRFLTDDSGKALDMFQAWSYIGENDSTNGYYFFGCPAAYGGSFTSEGNKYVMAGVIGYSASLDGAVTPGWYEDLIFVWDCPAK